MADSAKLCETCPPLQSHLSSFSSSLAAFPSSCVGNGDRAYQIQGANELLRTSLLGYLSFVLYSPTCLRTLWMNLPPSLSKAPGSSKQEGAFFFCYANWFTDLGVVSLLSGVRKQVHREMLEHLRWSVIPNERFISQKQKESNKIFMGFVLQAISKNIVPVFSFLFFWNFPVCPTLWQSV